MPRFIFALQTTWLDKKEVRISDFFFFYDDRQFIWSQHKGLFNEQEMKYEVAPSVSHIFRKSNFLVEIVWRLA